MLKINEELILASDNPTRELLKQLKEQDFESEVVDKVTSKACTDVNNYLDEEGNLDKVSIECLIENEIETIITNIVDNVTDDIYDMIMNDKDMDDEIQKFTDNLDISLEEVLEITKEYLDNVHDFNGNPMKYYGLSQKDFI